MNGANPTNGLEGTCEYPIVNQGKPVNKVPRSHSHNIHSEAAINDQSKLDEVPSRAKIPIAAAGKSDI